MTKEATERSAVKCTAHTMRAAAMRLARERAAEETDPAQAYGCVEWFRYDVTPQPLPETDMEVATGASVAGNARAGAALGH